MKTTQIIFNLLLIFLALHLLYSNSDLLIDMQNIVNDGKKTLTLFDQITKIAFALSYSIITVTLLFIYPRLWLIIAAAILDGFGIYLKYNIYQENFIQLAAVYFGIYTCLVVISSGFIAREKAKTQTNENSLSENQSEKSEKEKETISLEQNYNKPQSEEISISYNSESINNILDLQQSSESEKSNNIILLSENQSENENLESENISLEQNKSELQNENANKIIRSMQNRINATRDDIRKLELINQLQNFKNANL